MRWWQKECCSMREQRLLSCATTVLIPEGFATGSLQQRAELSPIFKFAFLSEKIEQADFVKVQTKLDKKGKFGRVLGDFLIDDKSVATIMCETGHAVAYYGGNKDELQAKHMANRQKLVAEGVVTGAVE